MEALHVDFHLPELNGHAQWVRRLPGLVNGILDGCPGCPRPFERALKATLFESDPFLPRRLIQTLREAGHESPVISFRILALFLVREEPYLREDVMGACSAIAAVSLERLDYTLIAWAGSDFLPLRRAAARSLTYATGDPPSIRGGLLNALARDWHHSVRLEIARGTKRVPPLPVEQAFSLLHHLAGDPRLTVRRSVLASLIALGDRFPHRTLPVLKEMLGYLVGGLREAFLENLVEHRDAFLPLALEVLAGLERMAETVPEGALEALPLITEESDWMHPRLLARCARLTAALSQDTSIDHLLAKNLLKRLQNDDDPGVRHLARQGLASRRIPAPRFDTVPGD